VPKNAPEDAELGVTMTHQDLVKHLGDSSKWSRRGGKFDEVEFRMIAEMTSLCKCGGSMISELNAEIVYLCPNCKSADLRLGEYRIFD
jgi:hypothetical protein